MKRYLSQVDANKITTINKEGTSFDRIKGNLIYGDEYIRLTPVEIKMLERWNVVFNMLKRGDSTLAIQGAMKRLYNVESMATVYRDIAAAKKLFGSIDTIDKNAERLVAMEWARITFKMALKDRDLDAMNNATRNYIKASALENDDPDTLSEEDLQQHVYYAIIKTDSETLQMDLSGLGLEKLPKRKAQGIIQSLYKDIDDVEAIEFIGNGKQTTES